MILDIYNITHDDKWLKKAYLSLKNEYKFWMEERITPIGLNRYYHHKKTKQEIIDFYQYACTRLSLDKNAKESEQIYLGECLNACGESGLDFSPRFALKGIDIIPVDLNSLLYGMEYYLALWAKKFEPNLEKKYIEAYQKRALLMKQYLYDDYDHLYHDYNYVNQKIENQDFYYTAMFLPFMVGIHNDKEALMNLYHKLASKYGIYASTPYSGPLSYQAAYPYSWPYDNALAFFALVKLGLNKEAEQVATCYLDMCANSYIKTSHLWETYDASNGEIANKKEYANKEMLGWTAGVYQILYNYLKKQK